MRTRHGQLLRGRSRGGQAGYAELLGFGPYFERAAPDGRPAYLEFRIGDYEHELGIIDGRFAPHGAAAEPAGAIVYWHVDDRSPQDIDRDKPSYPNARADLLGITRLGS